MINKPQLPPKKGYVETIVDGERVYKRVETEETVLSDAIVASVVDLEYKMVLIEMKVI